MGGGGGGGVGGGGGGSFFFFFFLSSSGGGGGGGGGGILVIIISITLNVSVWFPRSLTGISNRKLSYMCGSHVVWYTSDLILPS